MILNLCIGCGCDEAHACVSDPDQGPCWWMRFSHAKNLGVCSYCEDRVKAWEAGDQVLRPERIVERFHRQVMFLYQGEASAKAWMNAPHELLGGRSPRDVILAGEIERVHAIIDQLRDGAYA